MSAGQVKSAGPLHFRTRNKLDPFGSGFGPAGHRHPRRDDEGHGNEGKQESAEEKATREAAEKTAAEKLANKNAATQAAAEKKRADAAEKALKDLQDKHATDEEKKVNEQVGQKVTEAVSAKEVELTDAFGTQIRELQTEIIDTVLDAALAAAGRTRADFATVLSTLDRTGFVGDDGKVKKDEVTKWASELAGSSSARPPRTGEHGSKSSDRGFGRFVAQK